MVWRRRGRPRYVATPGKNLRVAVMGAVRWPHGPFRCAYAMGNVNTALVVALLERLAAHATRARRRIVLVLDNGSANTSKRSVAAIAAHRAWLRVYFLPTYASEQLNEIEGLWQHLKADYFSEMLAQRAEDFPPAVLSLLKRLQRQGALRALLAPRGRKGYDRI